ncbi:sensor histidine kinase [Roseateles cellulosilyticus]|uniref:Histidine kinase n=1 Tax=Pelomonas cellulosilytica TaxID=2906762 RepID=A0ABS8XSK4_9BURK|nr:histidine kinase [Pelomonas sp. P8]MCE4553679.1 histidine kinase [Pelomonas sp. P8]
MSSLIARLQCRNWFYPGPLRVFTPDEMARAGMQPWPVAVDSYVAVNLLILAPLMLWSPPGELAWQVGLAWWALWCALAVGALAIARSLWRRPTRRRLNLYCYGVATALMLAGIWLIKNGYREWVLRENVTAIAVLTGALSAWWMLTVFRVQQIEGRLRELAEQDAALKLSTRLAAAQIQPHFLFNTLASLQHWVDTGDARAAPLLRDFTAYLRATLPMFERELQPLADEIEMVRRYLAVMQARLGARLTFAIDVPRDVQAPLPPGVVLTLVENAIAHGIEPQLRGGRIDVAARHEGAHLVVSVRDDGPGLAPGWTQGVGLSNTCRRLMQASPGATLDLADAHPGCLATLTLPCPT